MKNCVLKNGFILDTASVDWRTERSQDQLLSKNSKSQGNSEDEFLCKTKELLPLISIQRHNYEKALLTTNHRSPIQYKFTIARKIIEYLKHQNVELLDHLSYNLDWGFNDFFLFSKIKNALRGWPFQKYNFDFLNKPMK